MGWDGLQNHFRVDEDEMGIFLGRHEGGSGLVSYFSGGGFGS